MCKETERKRMVPGRYALVMLSTACVMLAAVTAPAGVVRGSAERERQEPSLSDTTMYRVRANSLSSRQENDIEVFYLEGDVTIEHQTATITSDRGKHYLVDRQLVLSGNVHGNDGTLDMFGDVGKYFGLTNTLEMENNVRIIDKGMEITCDRAVYHRGEGTVVLVGHVVLSDSSRVMYADSIYYDRNIETADANGNVVIIDYAEEYSISGRHARFFRNTSEAVMDVRPVLTFDDRAVVKGRVTSEWMYFNMDVNRGSAVGDVRMVKGDTRATCDSAAIFNEEGYLEMFGDPEATSGSTGMTGKKVVLYYDDAGVNRIDLPATGKLTESPAPGSPWREDSWIEGDSLVIYISNDEADSVKIFGNAKAMYYPYEGDENKVSNNYSKGDSMYFRFSGDDLKYVRISSNATGVYNYLNLEPSQTIDSLAAAIDSTLGYRDFTLEAQKVRYSAKDIEYFADTEDIVLRDSALLEYQNKALSADRIDFSSRLNILEAEGSPVLEEDAQKMYGVDMGYDMDSEGGLVFSGSTKYDKGYYSGKYIFKEGDDILKVYNSVYTTCDLKSPHYSMRAGKMKVYINDKIVSGPITLYIGEIPVFYLPFMANTLKRDRHSGILRPNFDIGINSRDGRFIRGLGYYWATNEYTDFILKTDFNENQNFRVNIDNRYSLRYVLDGSVNFNFFRNFVNKTNEWTVKSSHNQKFGRTASLRSSLNFVSSDKAQSSMFQADDVQRSVDRKIYSSASFSKSWGGTRLGLSATRNQTLNIDPETSPTAARVTTTMPDLSLSFPRTSLWFGEKHGEGEKGGWERALGSIAFSPNIRARRTTSETAQRETARLTASSGASFGQQHKLIFLNLSPSVNMSWRYEDVLYDRINEEYIIAPAAASLTGGTIAIPDSFIVDSANDRISLNVDNAGGVEYFIADGVYYTGESLAAAIESAIGASSVTVEFVDGGDHTGHFVFRTAGVGSGSSIRVESVSSSPIYDLVGLNEGMYSRGTDRSGPVEDTTHRNEFSMSLSSGIGTSLYGVFYPKIGTLRGIRHTFNPTVSYSYTPAFTENQQARQNVTYSIRNVIDLKYMKGKEEQKANNALTWNISGSYNPQASKETRFSNIGSHVQTSLGRLASISFDHTIDPLERKIISTRFSANMSLSGGISYPSKWERSEQERIAAAQGEQPVAGEADSLGGVDRRGKRDDPWDERLDMGGDGGGPPSLEHGTQGWSLRIGYSFSSQGEGAYKSVSNQIDISGSLKLTRSWKIGYNAHYDMETRSFTNQQYSINRDLHCWQAGFVHRKFGNDWSYYFQISIKELPDIMYERGTSGLRGAIPF